MNLLIGGIYMEIKRCKKESFVVIGKEGYTLDGEGFIQKLWKSANELFSLGKIIFLKDYILQEQNAGMMQLYQMDGQSG